MSKFKGQSYSYALNFVILPLMKSQAMEISTENRGR